MRLKGADRVPRCHWPGFADLGDEELDSGYWAFCAETLVTSKHA